MFELRDLLNAFGVAAGLESRREPHLKNFVGERRRHDPRAEREHVGVVMLPGQASCEQIQAERGTDARDLVRGDLLPLAAPPNHNAAIELTRHHRAADGRTDAGIVNRFVAVSTEIADVVAESLQRALHVLLQEKARVVRTEGDAHARIVL